ncbi:MAG: hypothetical protein UX17_C0067G0007 [Parcubacteria group bacterium GW2011_GWC2_45_7]|nr:MAG: hypothetical protein UX17_C0067G0007 [Parcubacteria group bacterium GW2011_GWC2_45_7]KKU72747.1 MAG: hypothetical protein UX98_C0018G0026 [Parcubacteria group bacterium GW2011_GWA2_47_26]
MKNSYRILVLASVLFTGIIIFIAVVMMPSISGIVDLRKKIATEREELEIASAKAANYRKNVESTAQVQAEIADLESTLIQHGREVDYFTKLEGLARQHNVNQTLTLEEGSNFAKSVRAFPMDLKIKGDFTNFVRYLIDIERQNELLAIKTLSISSTPRDNQTEDVLQITLNGLIYVRD